MDDCLTGAHTIQEASEIKRQLNEMLSNSGMILRKWRSNSPAFIETIPESLRETTDLLIKDPSLSSKTLGIHWNVEHDHLCVSAPAITDSTLPTKRIIASVTAKVFDILGLFSPVIVTAKMLLQHLWILKLDWDSPTSKARVVPIKPSNYTTTGIMLTKLLLVTSSDLKIPSSNIFAWTDSSIVLSWIAKSPAELNTFVSNRVCSSTVETGVS